MNIKKDSTTISNDILNDNRLSWKAKGILIYLLSQCDNQEITIKDIVDRGIEKEAAIYNGLKELKKLGYYRKVPIRDKEGKISHWKSFIYQNPEEASN